jgi:RNA polymerase sigma factor (TIGR02999 family)
MHAAAQDLVKGCMEEGSSEITNLLARLNSGQPDVSARLIALVYPELHAIAGRAMRRERPDHTLQATVLVHEAYLRLVGQSGIRWENRAQFFGFAASVMRRVLVDYAREHRALKRGGAAAKVTLDDALLVTEDHMDRVLMIDDSLRKLAAVDPDQSRVVELRFFAGMNVEETAEALGVSTATVKREWSHAKAWLQRDMRTRGAHGAA